MLIDTHCHLLPGLDDGPKNLAEAMVMARSAVEQGITHVLCTPHYNQRYCPSPAQVIQTVQGMQAELKRAQIPLTLFEGHEIFLTDQLPTEVAGGAVLGADVKNHYLLVELPSGSVPVYTETVLYHLVQNGHRPVIVHPERNLVLQNDWQEVEKLLNIGCLMQVTAPSLVGTFGRCASEAAWQMLSAGQVHLIASDAHGLGKRAFYLKEAYATIAAKMGERLVQQLQQQARAVVNGERIDQWVE